VPTGGTATPGETGTAPTATVTPGGTGNCGGLGPNITITVQSEPGSDLDTGWKGIAHNQPAIEQVTETFDLTCVGDDCTLINGDAKVGTTFGSPLPLAAGGVGSCVINTFRAPVTGTYNCASGCSEGAVQLTSQVFLAAEIDKPCPKCLNDPTPNDGVAGGTCDGGATPGAVCDVGGISPTFGPTSDACRPSGSDVGQLSIDLMPITTGTISQTGSGDCFSSAFPDTCFCPMQDRPNDCSDRICPASGVCEGTVDSFCSGQRYRVCDISSGDRDCEGTFPGAGTCEIVPRPCFGDTVSRSGTCAVPPNVGTLVSFFCIPATSTPAINTVAGLPGPGVVSLPVSSVRASR
jgi:hypothetical protein